MAADLTPSPDSQHRRAPRQGGRPLARRDERAAPVPALALVARSRMAPSSRRRSRTSGRRCGRVRTTGYGPITIGTTGDARQRV
jgi:hypothetical protein